MKNERNYGWGMNIMTAIIDSPTLDIMYIGLMLHHSIYVIPEKRIALSAQKHFTISSYELFRTSNSSNKSYRITLNHLNTNIFKR